MKENTKQEKNTKENKEEIKEQELNKVENQTTDKTTDKNLEKEQTSEKTDKKEVKGKKHSKEKQEKQEKSEQTEQKTNTIESLEKQLKEMQDKYLRLAAEYDNYRKRTMKEKMELIKSGGEDVIVNILPVIDNFERALKAIDESDDVKAVKEGIHLIYNQFIDYLKQRGVSEIEALNKPLDTDLHEAVAQVPAQEGQEKGKIIDVIQKGYKMKDKVIRFAKVVVAQ